MLIDRRASFANALIDANLTIDKHALAGWVAIGLVVVQCKVTEFMGDSETPPILRMPLVHENVALLSFDDEYAGSLIVHVLRVNANVQTFEHLV